MMPLAAGFTSSRRPPCPKSRTSTRVETFMIDRDSRQPQCADSPRGCVAFGGRDLVYNFDMSSLASFQLLLLFLLSDCLIDSIDLRPTYLIRIFTYVCRNGRR